MYEYERGGVEARVVWKFREVLATTRRSTAPRRCGSSRVLNDRLQCSWTPRYLRSRCPPCVRFRFINARPLLHARRPLHRRTSSKNVIRRRLLFQHVEAGKRASERARDLSHQMDQSNVGILNLSAGCFTLPNNVACFAVAQVSGAWGQGLGPGPGAAGLAPGGPR